MLKQLLRKLGLCSSLLAIFVANGGHWMALQTVAWTRMLAVNASTDTFADAVRKTFDGQHGCRMCHQIQEGREEERRPAAAIASTTTASRLWLEPVSSPGASPSSCCPAVLVVAAAFRCRSAAAPPDPPPRRA